jgi:hypothetical protein
LAIGFNGLFNFYFMALHPDLTFTQDAENIDIGIVDNTTPDYGTGGNPARGDAAEYLLWSKTNQDAVRDLLPVDQGNVLTNLQYNVQSPLDGWYEGIRLRIQPYDAGANYVEQQPASGIITQYASIFYYGTTNKVYKAILPSTGQDPVNTTYFVEVLEEDMLDLLPNTNVEVFIKDFYVKTRASKCLSSLFAKLDDCSCSNGNARQNNYAYYLRGLVMSADSEFAQGSPNEMDKIIRQVNTKCSSS